MASDVWTTILETRRWKRNISKILKKIFPYYNSILRQLLWVEQTFRHEKCQTLCLMHLFPGSSWMSTALKQEDKTRRRNLWDSRNRIQLKSGSKEGLWGGDGDRGWLWSWLREQPGQTLASWNVPGKYLQEETERTQELLKHTTRKSMFLREYLGVKWYTNEANW